MARHGIFNTTSLLAIPVLVAAFGLASVASASAEITVAQREACTPDALRLCSSEIPDVAKVKACMQANKANLSARCRSAFPSESVKQAAIPASPRAKAQKTRIVAGGTHVVVSHRHRVARAERAHRRSYGGYGADFAGLGGGNAAGFMSLLGGGGQRRMNAGQAMGMARQMMTTYRAACGNQSIPAEYCGF